MENFFASLEPWLKLNYFGNTLQEYLIALGILLGFWIFFKVLKNRLFSLLKTLLKKSKKGHEDKMIQVAESIPASLYFFSSLYFALQVIQVHPLMNKIIGVILTILIIYWLTKVTSKIVEYSLDKFTEKKGEKNMSSVALIFVLKLVLWTIGFLLALSNLGVDISALITSLGIGGIAVALAVQNILGDMFSSFTIYLDKPFEIGDYIVVGEHSGTVKKIGLKSTRIQALQGEEIVISNKELTTARVQNFKRMEKRRIAFEVLVSPETKASRLSEIPKMLEKMIKKNDLTEFNRAHFKTIAEGGYKFEIVYQMKTSEYKDYMDTQEKINLDILKTFEKEKIRMAFAPLGFKAIKEK